MKTLHITSLWGLLFLCLFTGSGCGAYLNQPMKTTSARVGEETTLTESLRQLPKPNEKIVVAVYKFRDQTGQYKPMENGASWSTAVTQGATNILISSLEKTGWFRPIERENVGNLLNERKIIRSSHAQFNKENNQKPLPPLLFAGLILEGGIVSYDANILTGGAGVRYFGAGGSGQYRQDRVTVYLRAISTKTGEIVKTIYTSKTVLSQAVDVGLFRFVKFKRLLEVETGFTYNEPSEMAVTEAIEKAVQSLVIEGIMDKMWAPKDPKEINGKAILEYRMEKEKMKDTDVFGREIKDRRQKLSWMIYGSGNSYAGDYAGAKIKEGFGLSFQYNLSPQFGLNLNYGTSQIASKDYFQTNLNYIELNGQYRLLPFEKFTPYLFGGFGYLTTGSKTLTDWSQQNYSKLNAGMGFEYLIHPQVGIDFSLDHHYTMTDELDAMNHGKYNDAYWRGRIGLRVYFNKNLKRK